MIARASNEQKTPSIRRFDYALSVWSEFMSLSSFWILVLTNQERLKIEMQVVKENETIHLNSTQQWKSTPSLVYVLQLHFLCSSCIEVWPKSYATKFDRFKQGITSTTKREWPDKEVRMFSLHTVDLWGDRHLWIETTQRPCSKHKMFQVIVRSFIGWTVWT